MKTLTKSNADHPLILFDGVCNLCNWSVQVVIRRDSSKRFRFASLQSHIGQDILGRDEIKLKNIDSIVLLYHDTLLVKSDAILQIFKLLGGPGYFLYGLKIIPKPIRDTLYDWIARNRYGWFGKQDVCMIPTPELEERFIA